jgi:transposase
MGWRQYTPSSNATTLESKKSVFRYLHTPTCPGQQHRSTYGRSLLTPYTDYLLTRWNAGCRTAMQLFRELQPQGYTWSYAVVAAYARRLRQAQGLPPGRRRPGQALPAVVEPTARPLTPRRATWLVLRRAAQRTADDAQQLAQIRAQSAALTEAIDLAQDFAQLVRQRQPAQLDPWLQRAASSTLDAVRRFATGLYDDYQAVKAGVTLPWSSGPVEGHINRLKMLKRQMFGRAHLDLLGHRFLRAPREREAQVVGPRAPVQVQAAALAA